MKKSLLVVFVSLFLIGFFASASDSNETGDNHESENRQENRTGAHFTGLSTDAITCVTTAVTIRDTTIKTGMLAYDATWSTTFDARTAAFIAALSLTNKKEMKKAMDLAWKTSEKAMKTAQKTKKSAVQAARNVYRTSLKACNTDIAKGLMSERGGNDLDD